jgi:hypothetical protein
MNETLRVPAAHSREGRGLYSCAKQRGCAIPHRGWPGLAKPHGGGAPASILPLELRTCQQSRRARLAINFSTDWACVSHASDVLGVCVMVILAL